MSSTQPPADVDSDDELLDTTKPETTAQEAEPAEDTTLANSDVVTKYQEAAKIVQAALLEVQRLAIPGAKILDICTAGDAFILEKTSAIFRGKGKNGKTIDRGIAFPVCISVNEYVCHYSPLPSEDKLPPLVEGDMVKVDLGAHIDGYIAVGAHTIVVGHVPIAATPATGPRADVITAVWAAAEISARLIKAGAKNHAVTEAIKKVADHFGVKTLAGIQMNQMKRYVIDGKKVIQLREEDDRVETCEFETYEVYAIDVVMSTGEGKPKATDLRTTVFKRQVDQRYGLKVKASRQFFNEVNKKFPTMPFTLRYVEGEETTSKMGVRECVTHGLLTPYGVLAERAGDHIAHVKYTVLLMPNGTVKVTGLEKPEGFSSRELPEELAALLAVDEAALAAEKKKLKKKAARSKKAGGGASAGATEEEA